MANVIIVLILVVVVGIALKQQENTRRVEKFLLWPVGGEIVKL